MKVSVLMAVHNEEKYVAKAMDSLLGQTYKNLEVICVDDASTDNSHYILDEYAQKDERVKVVHLTKNVGQAKARNIALQMVEGDFVVMLDADDWYAVVSFEKAIKVFKKFPDTDIVLFNIINIKEYGEKIQYRKVKTRNFDVLTGEEAFSRSIEWDGIHGIYMIRADIHKRYPFDDSCMLYSDDNTARIHFAVAREVRRCHGRYFYRQHPESVTHKISDRLLDRLPARESLLKSLKEVLGDKYLKYQERLTTSLWLHVVDCYMVYNKHSAYFSPEAKQQALSNMQRIRETIDRKLVNRNVSRKFGYRFMPTWDLFLLQERIYFALRRLTGKE